MAKAKVTRASSASSSGSSSCINVAGAAARDSSPSAASQASSHASTPPTSFAGESVDAEERGKTLFDRIAQLDGQEETADLEQPPSRSRSAKRSKSAVASYNLAALSDAQWGSAKARTKNTSTRTFSGETLVDRGESSTSTPQRELLREGVKALDVDSETDELDADAPEASEGPSAKKVRSRRNSAHLLAKAAVGAVSKVKSVLGKRGREAMDAGKEALGIKSKRQSSRLAVLEQDKAGSAEVEEEDEREQPSKKSRALVSNLQDMGLVAPNKTSGKGKRGKHFLEQGLYVGQQESLTESKKKSKECGAPSRPQSCGSNATTVQRTALPLPMFQHAFEKMNDKNFALPFDVFAPCPRTEKPKDWIKKNKNVFIGDAKSEWRIMKLEASVCTCKPPPPGSKELGCGENCINRSMEYECDDSNCKLGAELCSNRAFAELAARYKPLKRDAGREDDRKKVNAYNVGVDVFKTGDRGFGVRSNRTFKPGQIIVEYSGEVINQEECDRRMNNEYKGKDDYYLMTFEQRLIIDATKGSIARFVNHSCEPNCTMEKRTVAGVPRMALFAGPNGIMTGEELTYDYNFDPFSDKNVQVCRCGAPTCRGYLGPRMNEAEKRQMLRELERKEKEEREAKERREREKESLSATLKRKLLGVGGESGDTKEEKKVLKKRKVPSLPRGWAYVDPKVEAQRLQEEAIVKGKALNTLQALVTSKLETTTVRSDREERRLRRVSSATVTAVEKGGRKSIVRKTETRIERSVSPIPKTTSRKAGTPKPKKVEASEADNDNDNGDSDADADANEEQHKQETALSKRAKGNPQTTSSLLSRAATNLSRTASVLSRHRTEKDNDDVDDDDGGVVVRERKVLRQTTLSFSKFQPPEKAGEEVAPLLPARGEREREREGKLKRAGSVRGVMGALGLGKGGGEGREREKEKRKSTVW